MSIAPDSALRAVADALRDDPFYVAITSSRAVAEKKQILLEYLDYSCREAARIGKCVYEEQGLAIWALPCSDDVLAAAEAAAKSRYMTNLLGEDFDTYKKINEFMSAQTSSPEYQSAWYLSILGVAPAYQRSGIGRRLLSRTLSEVDEAEVDCFLETFDDNTAFYERFGFKKRNRRRGDAT